MHVAVHISVDLGAGEIRLGARRIGLLAASAPYAFYLEHKSGPVLRALRFQERALLLLGAKPHEVAERVAEVALVTPGAASEALRRAVSLALAGGAEEVAPFSECADFAARQEGWDRQRVSDAPALVVDRLNRPDAHSPPDTEWKRIVFPQPEPDLDALVAGMVENLLQRAAPSELADLADSEPIQPVDRLRPGLALHLRASVGRAATAASALGDAAARRVGGAGGVPTTAAREPTPVARPADGAPPDRLSCEASHNGAQTDRPAAPFRTTTRAKLTVPAATPIHAIEASAPLRARVETVRLGTASRAALASSAAVVAPGPAARPLRRPLPSGPLAASVSQPWQAAASDLDQPTAHARPPDDIVIDGPSSSDWMAELAAALEIECDLRGLDP